MKKILLASSILLSSNLFSQGGPPWNNPLKMSWSNDGVTFTNTSIFQDSSGVPSVIKWNGDTLLATFQWFRQPNPSPSWDRVATKISYDNGLTWSAPSPIIINGLPSIYQRPFDPTLVALSKDTVRIYFSSSNGIPVGLDSTVNTYSAVSTDGINFTFEPGPRVDESQNRVIDPAVIYFNSSWHYASPIGAPQQGAYHYISPDGMSFSKVPDITSDNIHNWTGNYVEISNTELRFYGSGQYIWYNSSANGGVWNGYVNTNIQGGDPSVVKLNNNSYLMIYVGQPYPSGVNEYNLANLTLYPNPSSEDIKIQRKFSGPAEFVIMDLSGKLVLSGLLNGYTSSIDISGLVPGSYIIQCGEEKQSFQVYR